MPNFTDYLLAPWKIVTVLWGILHAGSPGGATASSAAIQGSLCVAQDLGGQIEAVCHIAGYNMPEFILWASFFIFLLFLAASTGLLYQCSKLGLTMNRIVHKLSQGDALHAYGKKTLTAINSVMQKERAFVHLWHQFEGTLLVSTENQEVYSTQSPESVFTKAALIEDNVHASLFSAIPGVLTGLGLLMTFIAILDGLSHVTVSSSMDVKGIGGLINGLSGKFISSIVAVTCSVIFVFVERIAYGRVNQAYRKLLPLLSTRFKRKTTEQLLFQIQSQLAEQAALLERRINVE